MMNIDIQILDFLHLLLILTLIVTVAPNEVRTFIGLESPFSHLNIWINEPMPVIIVLFDAADEKAYWVYLQSFIESENISAGFGQKHLTVRFHKNNIVSTEAVRKWKKYKDRILNQLEGYISHDA